MKLLNFNPLKIQEYVYILIIESNFNSLTDKNGD
jgi:hypothetical protein